MTENRRRRDDNKIYERATSPQTAGKNLSWGAIFAGAISAAAVFLVLNLITAALGFGFLNPTDPNPLSGIGVATGIWTIVTLIVSFLAGGFVAGYAARSTGILHGGITWALAILLLFTLVFNALASALGFAGNVLGTVAGGVGSAATSVATTAESAISDSLSSVGDSIAEVDTEELQNNLETYLADTEVEELQPDYIKNKLQESRDEVTAAVKDLAVNPENSEQIVTDLANSLGEKAGSILGAVDEDAVYTAVSNNSDLSEEEIQEISSNIYNGLTTAAEAAQETLTVASEEASKLVNQVATSVNQGVENAKQGAQDATNKASFGSVLVFVGLLLALVVSAIGGKLGEKASLRFVER